MQIEERVSGVALGRSVGRGRKCIIHGAAERGGGDKRYVTTSNSNRSPSCLKTERGGRTIDSGA